MFKGSKSDKKARVHDLVSDFDVAMLAVRGDDGVIRSRPMRVAKLDDDGAMWFLASGSGKTLWLAHDVSSNVTLQGHQRFVSLSGIVTLVDDRSKVTELWSEPMRLWFPDGPRSPDLTAVEFVPSEAEYWDMSGVKAVRYLFAVARAMLTGREISPRGEAMHGVTAM